VQKQQSEPERKREDDADGNIAVADSGAKDPHAETRC
jgi:hypothetical protein